MLYNLSNRWRRSREINIKIMHLITLVLVLHVLLGVYPPPDKEVAEAQITIIPTTKQIDVITTPTDTKLTILNEVVTPTPIAISTPKTNAVAIQKPAIDTKPRYDVTYIKKRICEVFVNNCKEALIIAHKESNYSTTAVSRTGDYGVFQLNCRWQKRRVGGDCTRFLDLETNLKVAKQIFNEQGWNPWTTKKYLP